MATTSKTAKTAQSATAKKSAAKKPAAAKTTAAKKTVAVKKTATAAKKPGATKTAAAKKPAVKKAAAVKAPAAKKAVVKKPAAAKKPAVKKAAAPVKKPAAAKKPVVAKAPAAKKAAPAAKKPAASKPAAKKPAAPKPAKPAAAATLRLMDLFDAYAQNKLPRDHGYIVSAFFSTNSAYTIYEIVSYSGVKEIHYTGTGLTFVTGGKKLSILIEPSSYPQKYMEPVSRKDGERIERRFSELEIITAKNQTKIMIAKEPNETYGSFTVLKPTGDNFARVVYNLPDVYDTIEGLFEKSFNQEAGVPQSDARTAATLVSKMVEKRMSFKGEFE